MAREALQGAIEELFAAPLEEFVSERTRLARRLRSAGNRPVAAELVKLPKPSAAAWALNHASREEPDAVGEWYAAVAALREASEHPQDIGGDAVRAAIAAHRATTEQLLRLVREQAHPNGRPLSEAMLDRVRTLLQHASASPELADRVRAGLVTEDEALSVALAPPAPPATSPPASAPTARVAARRAQTRGAELPEPDSEPSSGGRRSPAPAVPGPRRESGRGAQDAARRRKREAEVAARAARRAELEGQVARAEREVERLRVLLPDRAEAVQAADARLEEARRVLHRCESEAAATHDAFDEAEAAQRSANRDLETLRARLEELEGAGRPR